MKDFVFLDDSRGILKTERGEYHFRAVVVSDEGQLDIVRVLTGRIVKGKGWYSEKVGKMIKVLDYATYYEELESSGIISKDHVEII